MNFHGSNIGIKLSANYNKRLADIRDRDRDVYNRVISAQTWLDKNPEPYLKKAHILNGLDTKEHLWITVKRIRFVIHKEAEELCLHDFIIQNLPDKILPTRPS